MSKSHRTNLLTALGIIGIVAAYGLAGSADYERERLDAKHYCDMVAIGAWPDFRPEIDCTQGDGTNETA